MSNSRFGLRVRSGLISGIIEADQATSYILDSIPGASFAFSLRSLRNNYAGSCIRVRRSSDNTELDIGFVSGSLDTTTLISFVGVNNGFVTKWYDQSGNSRDVSQATQANQPQIVSSGALITLNNKACISTDGVNDNLKTASSIPTYTDATMIMVGSQLAGDSNYGRFIDNDFSTGFWFGRDNANNSINGGFIQPNPPFGNIISVVNSAQFVLFSSRSGAVTTTLLNNGSSTSITTTSAVSTANVISIGSAIANTFYGRKYHQEYIFYNSNIASRSNEVNTSINKFYSIY